MLSYDTTKKLFISKSGDIEYSMPFLYLDENSSGERFDVNAISERNIVVELYKSPLGKEDVSTIVYSDGERIGGIIPHSALIESCENLKKGHFILRWYAFVATSYAVEYYQTPEQDPQIGTRAFLILSKSDLEDKKISIVDCAWALAHESFYLKSDKSNSLSEVSKAKIKLLQSSNYLRGNNYIKDYLTDYLYEADSIKCFLYHYQVIEMLMDDCLMNKLNTAIIQCYNGNLSKRSNNELGTEISLFNELLEKSKLKQNPDFDVACKEFLKAVDKDLSLVKEFPDSLYQVRNTIVHRMRKVINDDVMSLLDAINDYFEFLNIEIIHAYNNKSKLVYGDFYDFSKEMSDSI